MLGLLLLIALLLLLSRCGNDDDAKPATSSTSPAAAPPATATTSAPASATSAPGDQSSTDRQDEPGTVTAAGVNLLDAAANGAGLNTYSDQQAVGRGVRVQSVPADEGFWVGTSAQDRLWVQLSGTGSESDYKVKQGDTVDFTGTVTRTPRNFAAETGLTPTEGADQLTEQGAYVSAPSSSIKLSR